MSRQIIGQQFFETEYFPFKKTGPGQIQTEDLHHPSNIRSSRLSWTGTHGSWN